MSEEKELSGEEKRAKLKEEYKRELLERKKLMEQVEQAKKMNPIQKALDEIQRINDSLSGTVDDIIDKLNMGSAEAEARMEVAIEGGTQTQPKQQEATKEQAAATTTQQTEASQQTAQSEGNVEKTLLDSSTSATATAQTSTTSNTQPENEAGVQTKKTLGEQEH